MHILQNLRNVHPAKYIASLCLQLIAEAMKRANGNQAATALSLGMTAPIQSKNSTTDSKTSFFEKV